LLEDPEKSYHAKHRVTENDIFDNRLIFGDNLLAPSLLEQDKWGYRVSLYFLRLDSPELAIERVAERVRQGGHAVPEAVIRRRFSKGLLLFDTVYRFLVDDWMLFDNSGEQPELIEWGEKP